MTINRDEEIEKLKQSITLKSEKRKYGEGGKQKRTHEKQGISEKHGWTSRMRTKFFKMSSNMNTLILKDDMTDPGNRPEGVTRKKDVQAGKVAVGFWSDNYLDRSKSTFENFLKFVIERDEERRRGGFYKKNPKVKEINNLKDLNHHDVQDFIDHKLESGLAASSVRNYVTHIKKVGESTTRHGIKGHKNLVKQKNLNTVPERKRSEFIRNKGVTDGKRGHTLEQANQLIEHIKDPVVRAGVMVLTDIGTRKDTFFKLEWRDVLDNQGKVKTDYIDMTRPGVIKGGREQIAEISERVTEGLQRFWDNGDFKRDQKIFGDLFTPYLFEKELKKACLATEVDSKGFHAFRRATVEAFDEKVKGMTKEGLVDGFLRFVNVEVPHRTTGELYKPHNPIIEKEEPYKVPKVDSKGNQLYKKDGTLIMVVKKKQKKEGTWYVPMKTKLDETGHPIKGPKWTKEELMNSRIDFLRNLYVAEQISHNRPDANAPYRFSD